jgi:hypothetical protein
MISDKEGNVWVVEPGRGIIHSPAKETPYSIMSNFSLLDYKETGLLTGTGTDRYVTADKMLCKAGNLDVNGAFEILEAVSQRDGEWETAFSMVYSHREGSVYYCFDGDFEKILHYAFAG